MISLFDLFGFLSVLAHGASLLAQAVAIGTVAFAIGVLPRSLAREQPEVATRVRRIAGSASLALAVSVAFGLFLDGAILRASLGLSWDELAGASFMRAGLVQAVAALVLLALTRRGAPEAAWRLGAPLTALVLLVASLARSHAGARVDGAALMLVATALHGLGTAVWLGGLPAFRSALVRTRATAQLAVLGRRFSMASMTGVACIVAGAIAFAGNYIGSFAAAFGTAYGIMAIAKSALLAILLLLGLHNYVVVRRLARGAATRDVLRPIVEAEMWLGLAVVMAAASITSMPPAADVPDRVSAAEIRARLALTWPRLASPERERLALPALQERLDREWHERHSGTRPHAYIPGAGMPPPRNAEDIAWSEYNHHWAGVLVLAIGIAGLLQRTGHAPWARHWPLLMLALAAFLFVRSDPEAWPLGDIGFLASMRDPEVAQHRLIVVLVVAFAAFEWGVRTGRIAARALARVFPAGTAIGAVLLLTHSHALANVKEEALIEVSHVAIAVLGIVAASARWVEVEAADRWRRELAGWIWPLCFVAVGGVLLGYREA